MRPFSKWRGIRVDQVGRAGDHFGASAVIPFLVRADLMPNSQPPGEDASRCGAGTKSAAASAQIVRILGLQARPLGGGTSIGTESCVLRLSHAPARVVQRSSYSSCRRHHTPVSLRPLGARSSHGYIDQSESTPRAYVEFERLV